MFYDVYFQNDIFVWKMSEAKGFHISGCKKSLLLSDKDFVMQAGDRLPGPLNCPGTPVCCWTTNNDSPSSVLAHAYRHTLASPNYSNIHSNAHVHAHIQACAAIPVGNFALNSIYCITQTLTLHHP